MNSVFITGGPRNGTTLMSHIMISLGYVNASKNLNFANSEDVALMELIDNLNILQDTTKGLSFHQQSHRLLSAYFRSFNDDIKFKRYSIKHPLLISTPSIDPVLRMKTNHYYGEFIYQALLNFDCVIFIERNAADSLKSEIKQLRINHEISDNSLNQFAQDYGLEHEETSIHAADATAKANLQSKLFKVKYEDLVEYPEQFIINLASRLRISINPLIASIIAKTFITQSAAKRQPPEVYMLVANLLGSISRNYSNLESRSHDYSEFITINNQLSFLIDSFNKSG